MFRKNPQVLKSVPGVSRKGEAFQAMKKKRSNRIRRRIEKNHLKVKDPDVIFVGEVVEFEPREDQVLKCGTTHGRKMKNDPIFRHRASPVSRHHVAVA